MFICIIYVWINTFLYWKQTCSTIINKLMQPNLLYESLWSIQRPNLATTENLLFHEAFFINNDVYSVD